MIDIVLYGKGKMAKLIYESAKRFKNSVTYIDDIEDLGGFFEKNKKPLVFIVLDLYNWKDIKEAEEVLPPDVHYVYIFNFFKNTFIGPKRLKNDSGCAKCLINRWIMTKKDRVQLFDIVRNIEVHKDKFTVSHITRPLSDIVLNFAISQQEKKFVSYIINREDLSFSRSNFLPVPTCENCGRLEFDSKELAVSTFEDIYIYPCKNYRTLGIDDLKNNIKDYYLNKEFGIFNVLLDDVEMPFCISVANLPVKNGKDEVGVGRTNNYLHSQITGLLEGLERYCGMEPRGKKTTVKASYNEISKIAVDPREFGLHSEKQYEESKVLKKFDPNDPMDWVWGYSMTHKNPLLIPETFAYYGINIRDSAIKSFVYEISNGCALGGSILEAVLYGLFEVIERDAFLITWYTKMPLPKIDIEEIESKDIKLMINKFEYLYDYTLHFYDMTLDTGVPAVWALAKNNRNDERMNIMCSAGCHMDYQKALEGAIHELCGILPPLNRKFSIRHNELKELYKDFSLVKNMEDHSLLYGLKEAEKEFEFLLNSDKRIVTSKNKCLYYSKNAFNDFVRIVESLKQLELEVISVDQTAQELKKTGLHCAKVIVPGMIPMTFGHEMRRVNELDRLFEVPKKYGHEADVDSIRNGNVSPHPFP